MAHLYFSGVPFLWLWENSVFLHLKSSRSQLFMSIPILDSVKSIERQYLTGEEPVLVMCSDKNAYICKYMRSPIAAYKLVCELIGAQMAMAWRLNTPEIAFVRIRPSHWSKGSNTALSIGSKKMDGVVDVTPSTNREVKSSTKILMQLLKIALFDFWMANEDRNANNANLLYDVEHEDLASIDYGCIFNTATFEFPLSQLTSTDTILYSDMFQYLIQDKSRDSVEAIVKPLRTYYLACVNRCRQRSIQMANAMPKEWNVPSVIVENKINQLFESEWIDGVWRNFTECLTENLVK